MDYIIITGITDIDIILNIVLGVVIYFTLIKPYLFKKD